MEKLARFMILDKYVILMNCLIYVVVGSSSSFLKIVRVMSENYYNLLHQCYLSCCFLCFSFFLKNGGLVIGHLYGDYANVDHVAYILNPRTLPLGILFN